ncbi:MAG: glycosyltransferase family 4 protein [Acidimicrobiia bacterium]|nr:glycosyltransferase family 4 protein [Acidimicrobiia bacterium]MDH4364149.1 glycosyltransferase family 4 protein [Acidimicrobiia bacterium]MDH5288429.1 glycosyltransferase family 4 protein [Acidimicrobiia bacterium]
MKRHVLVTNDFPPKFGGIQNYLWELWRRLPPDSFAVYTTSHPGAAAFDADQPFRVERAPRGVLAPTPSLIRRIDALADEIDADLVLLDPVLPLGAIGPRLSRPYGLILHGAEVTVPGRLPGSGHLLSRILRSASLIVAAGNYPMAEAARCAGRPLPAVVVPPGVDAERFQPLGPRQRAAARHALNLGDDQFVVASVNRLVPRKGMDVLIRAAAQLAGEGLPIQVLIGGAGRQQDKLARLIVTTRAPARLLGSLTNDDVARLYGAADAMAMLCHDRWLGLEQEGFGIVFLEAAAAGIPQVAGRSGGAHEAVKHGVTGLVEPRPRDVRAVARALATLANDPETRLRMGRAARERVRADLDYDRLAHRLHQAIVRAEPMEGVSASLMARSVGPGPRR